MPLLGTRGAASARGFGFAGIFVAPPGQQAYTSSGTYSWVAPTGVTSVSVVAVGPGSALDGSADAGGAGGGLGYKNNITVIPGNSYTVVVGGYNTGTASYFNSTATVRGGAGGTSGNPRIGGTYTGDGGGNGGNGGSGTYPSTVPYETGGGGGAGGYSGNGGAGANANPSSSDSGSAGANGGGGGGASGYDDRPGLGYSCSGGGGGVGLLGYPDGSGGGAGGTGQGTPANGTCGLSGIAGKGGSSGANGGYNLSDSGGSYGGGGGKFVTGSGGAVRIIWPGTTRSFPNTNTGNL